ncbi:MAG TPA: cyclic nucleotide-binding domain-containing protein [Chitinophagales bacterium]|nr:cyclic nucleotide-binding domain-containing protein [Chitinophagales bacterium]
MLLIEKVLILKSLSIFEETPEPLLVEVASILEEMEREPETTLFQKGEAGNCLYIIYRGSVRIHSNQQTLAILKENDFFGELSLLDTEARSASATTVSDSYLLKLDQEPFYELMSNRVEVVKGVLKTLCKRLREQNELNTELKAKLQSI